MKPFALPLAILLACLVCLPNCVLAGSATWKLHPHDPYWIDTSNWTSGTIPNGPDDIATFGLSFKNLVAINLAVQVNAIVFTPDATTAFTVSSTSVPLTISGTGITNNSGITETFETFQSTISFTNNATAGRLIDFIGAGATDFFDNSTANESTFSCNVKFYDDATADIGNFTTAGGTETSSFFATVEFFGNSTAANGTFTNEGASYVDRESGSTSFFDSSTAANSVLIANAGSGNGSGGLIEFNADSNGGAAEVEVFGNGSLDITNHNPSEVTIGSLEGSGLVFLGANSLTLGSNNLSTTFNGVIQGEGSITKIGTGNLTLESANTYTGGTVVNGGILLANGLTGSSTGSGPILVMVGTFGGGGKVTGPVTIGTGNGAGAILAPGAVGVIPGIFSIGKKLQLLADATLKILMDSSNQATDKVIAKGMRIRRAQIIFGDRSTSVLPPGTVFFVIDNKDVRPISGTFSNLPDGSTVTVGNNTFQADYEGGDGNDLTLTVVP